VAYQSRTRISAHTVRRAVYWSLLNAPTAGVTYGGHGVWGWDDGTKPPTDHPNSGVPLAWKQALLMPGAEQMSHVVALFTGLVDFWRLRPAPGVLVEQPGTATAATFIAAAMSDARDQLVIYTPEPASIRLHAGQVPQGPAVWFDPRSGRSTPATPLTGEVTVRFETPGEGDWVLVVKR
jgi:hypothetical protein